ncbi:MAG: hypothetical protein WCP55_16720 [Lentisphaerota bacterium]
MLTRIDLRGVMELAGKKEQVKPIVYWCSTPVRPNETLMVADEDFAEKAVLEFAVGTKEEKWVEAKPLQASRQCLKADAGMRLVKLETPMTARYLRFIAKHVLDDVDYVVVAGIGAVESKRS